MNYDLRKPRFYGTECHRDTTVSIKAEVVCNNKMLFTVVYGENKTGKEKREHVNFHLSMANALNLASAITNEYAANERVNFMNIATKVTGYRTGDTDL